jgi:hypothetical protein
VLGIQPPNNEIERFITGRYISATEAHWRLSEYPLKRTYPNVVRLAIHLENMIDQDDDEDPDVAHRNRSTLTAFFEFNRLNNTFRRLTYIQFPSHLVWHSSQRKWSPRVRNSNAIGRVHYVPYSEPDKERFYLRLLLHNVRGPTCFDSLRIYNNVFHNNYEEAAIARGLADDNTEYFSCMAEAARSQHPSQLRSLYATILAVGHLRDPLRLWQVERDHMSEDYVYQRNAHNVAYNMALININAHLEARGTSLANFRYMPQIEGLENNNRLIVQALALNELALNNNAEVYNLNDDQQLIFVAITQAALINDANPKCFYIDGAGGTGKSYLFNALIRHFRRENCIVLPVSSTGLSATLLSGTTAHSMFKLPLNPLIDAACAVGYYIKHEAELCTKP